MTKRKTTHRKNWTSLKGEVLSPLERLKLSLLKSSVVVEYSMANDIDPIDSDNDSESDEDRKASVMEHDGRGDDE
eukprot:7130081-Ditylum_brightwellii.AAC.1